MSTLPYFNVREAIENPKPPTFDPNGLKPIGYNPPLNTNNSFKSILNTAGNLAPTILPQALSAVQGFSNAYNTAQGLKDTSSIEFNIKNRNNYTTYNDNQSLLNAWSEDSYLNNVGL